jgi:hypothetical protein
MNKISAIPSKLSTWITMLLVWNIVLLSIALFYLFNLTRNTISAEELASTCADVILSSQNPSL